MSSTLEKPQRKMTVEEFFEWQLGQDMNYELVEGVPVPTVKAMTGASRRHDTVTVNAIAFCISSSEARAAGPARRTSRSARFAAPAGPTC
ncbi:MAG TPA: hypothetical protein VGN97_09580 [Mesorhizobium sp.]|jgi:Uma2 family endonuclease|nr:hypothetical protein [Mesorhizobium sp.]